jgi:hypothetical protein
MQARKRDLENNDKVCFKEFDATLNRFVMVSKEDREVKSRQLNEKLKTLERENKEKQAKLNELFRKRKGGIFG